MNSRLSVLLSVNKVNFKYFTYLQKLFLGLFPLQMWLKYLLYVILSEVYFVVFFAEYGTILEIRLNPKVYKHKETCVFKCYAFIFHDIL